MCLGPESVFLPLRFTPDGLLSRDRLCPLVLFIILCYLKIQKQNILPTLNWPLIAFVATTCAS